MPLTDKGRKVMRAMTAKYGKEEGKHVFYASKNSGRISGVDAYGEGDPLNRIADVMEQRWRMEGPRPSCDAFVSHMQDSLRRGLHPRDAIKMFTTGNRDAYGPGQMAARINKQIFGGKKQSNMDACNCGCGKPAMDSARFLSTFRDEIFSGKPPRNAITIALGTADVGNPSEEDLLNGPRLSLREVGGTLSEGFHKAAEAGGTHAATPHTPKQPQPAEESREYMTAHKQPSTGKVTLTRHPTSEAARLHVARNGGTRVPGSFKKSTAQGAVRTQTT